MGAAGEGEWCQAGEKQRAGKAKGVYGKKGGEAQAVKQRLKRPRRPESLREDVRVSAATCAASTTMDVQPRPWCSKDRKQAAAGEK
ncbi:hypothetical protein COCSUDRAFT_68408 [Coccomyxa subellipsoidea C-169]|uniref:Uncharacterized protein n=1 Tax=Coccomyxa subellipsoidea (strain C-169) TaxID=574566 RepID=I0YI55_COCSC|nr:hypothetical protein COCSUDRAFT_68408 [Coccomyxa subellipsoidea C-169]EIE18074.1 hypothetical protein COCSUDRAFT_68408 [Coccomyxa subellipsoidea C-169]|eukprot:XP_005642618.1 hypothetical protein COCSUDRAFT_68408 [Coccomyxa subellipsoidea C-169]